jgi:hypothetical protein
MAIANSEQLIYNKDMAVIQGTQPPIPGTLWSFDTRTGVTTVYVTQADAPPHLKRLGEFASLYKEPQHVSQEQNRGND